jgi:hypothetical protein
MTNTLQGIVVITIIKIKNSYKYMKKCRISSQATVSLGVGPFTEGAAPFSVMLSTTWDEVNETWRLIYLLMSCRFWTLEKVHLDSMRMAEITVLDQVSPEMVRKISQLLLHLFW